MSSMKIQIELPIEKVAELFRDGHLCAGQIHCLTPESKQAIWQLCLETCGHTHCYERNNVNYKINKKTTLSTNLIKTQ